MAFLIACSSRADRFAAEVRALDPALDLRIAPDIGAAEEIDTALVWQPPAGLLAALPNLKLIVSVGAGVDALVHDATLPDVPLVRFVDPDLTGRMAEYIALHVLYHQRRMSEFFELQAREIWNYLPEPAAREVRVGLMGLGVLGSAAAGALSAHDQTAVVRARQQCRVHVLTAAGRRKICREERDRVDRADAVAAGVAVKEEVGPIPPDRRVADPLAEP